MQNPVSLKLLFVINPISGGKEKNDWEASIRGYFKDKPHDIEFYLLNGKDDITSIRHHIKSVNPDRIVAVGGDGTVKMLAELVKETKLPLGIIPAGSANGLAKELSIPSKLEEALPIITEGTIKKIDLIKINEEEICIHLSDIGMNALLVKYFEQSDKRGMWGYFKSIFKVLLEKQYMDVVIKTDKESLKRKAYMVVIANAQTYGTGAKINPKGQIDDGLFEIVLLRKLHVWELFKMMIPHKSFDPEYIEIFQAKNLELTTRRKAYFQIDGEYFGSTCSVKARILPQIVNIMLPPDEKLL
jgi:YegS/Rv2252/BmrU family lipid kinase